MKINYLSIALMVFCASYSCQGPKERLTRLAVEYTENPLGIETQHPRFGWQLCYPAEAKDVMQSAYQIIVTDESGDTVWDSGYVHSNEAQNIEYQGSELQPRMQYDWELTIWDNQGKELKEKSKLETSLMNDDDQQAWSGAKWIGGGDQDMVLFSQYLPVFKMNLNFKLEPSTKSNKVGFIYGANDHRLMDANKNIYHLANKKNESYVKIEVDLEPTTRGDQAIMNVYRIGYHPNDNPNEPIASFKIPKDEINKSNLTTEHTLTLYSELGYTTFKIGEQEIGAFNLNPLGRGGDFIAYPAVAEVGFAAEPTTKASMEICNFRSPENLIVKIDADPNAQKQEGMYLIDPSQNAMPMLRTTFEVKNKKIKKARLYATARGLYEMHINGTKVGDDYFNPGASQYNKTHFYQTYDVTDMLRKGQNAMGACLGEGWWSGAITYSGDNWNYFGDRQSLLAQLVINYADGEQQVVVTSPQTWKYFSEGPIVYGSFFQGEVYDARRETLVDGWTTTNYNDSLWKSVKEVQLEGHVSKLSKVNNPPVDDYSQFKLISQFGQTVQPLMTLQAQSVEEVRPGVYVYDMGQNMVGVPQIDLIGQNEGNQIMIRYAEVKYPDMPQYAGQKGMVMMENIRAAMSQDIYICRGGKETISPRFTYHGYRYLEITGIEKPLPVEDVKGIVLSSIDELKSDYETSNPKVNQLWKNITWSTYANFLSIPTDCPQRNERMGWAGDISVFSRTATYLANVPQFLRRYLRAMRDVQRPDGRFPDVAPLGGGFGGLLWGSAGLTVAWESYQQYGDKTLLTEHYDAMAKYIDFILATGIDTKTNILIQEAAFGNLGDWLSPEDMKNDKSLMWEAYFIYDLQLMQKFANILDKTDDIEKYKTIQATRQKHFNEMYINKNNGKTISSGLVNTSKYDYKHRDCDKGKNVDIQTSYVLPLAFGIVDEDIYEKFVENLVNTIKRENVGDDGRTYPPYSLMTGFIGTFWINPVLSECQRDDVAYNLLQQTSYPSWLYPIEQGSTTIWERLNSYTHMDGFGENNRMNSFNHYSFGAIGAWLCAYSLGIKRDENSKAFKHFILSPKIDPTGQMTWAKGHYDSPYGRIESAWKVEGDKVSYDFTIPANSSATLILPNLQEQELGSGSHSFTLPLPEGTVSSIR